MLKHNFNGLDRSVRAQAEVGIRSNHCRSIANVIKDQPYSEHPPRITLAVEGNISAGKSTFLDIIQNMDAGRELVDIVPEPVDQWQSIGAEHFNILDAFYKDPKRYAYTFQNFVFVTRMLQVCGSGHA